MELINSLVEKYSGEFTSPVDDLLEDIARRTETSHPKAHMMSSRLQGKFLELFSILLQPAMILEIGTFTGFSALCLVKGLKKGGILHTVELREADAEIARANFNRSNYSDRIILHVGNALEVLPGIKETWDMVFIDADKTAYLQYYQLLLPLMKKGGVVLVDNVLFHGEVLEEPVTGKNAKAIQDFNDYIKTDDRVEQVVLTIRDGLMIIRKK